ncbi:unnamed protein product [Symbiodinium sp. CCMP2592]|nr:unnamed protein product [Symbiodinium sp. CCMP2592]
MMKLLASQIFQLAQTTAMQISRNVLCKSHLPSSMLPHCFSTSFLSSQLQCQLVLPGSLANTGGEVPPSHVFGLRVESQMFQCRMLCFAKTMSAGAVDLRESRNARALMESSQVNGPILSVWCILNLLASQLHQPMEQTTAAQISRRSVYASRTSPPPSVMLQDQTTSRQLISLIVGVSKRKCREMSRTSPPATMKALLCPKGSPKTKRGARSAVALMLTKGCRSLLDGRPRNVLDSGEGWHAASLPVSV